MPLQAEWLNIVNVHILVKTVSCTHSESESRSVMSDSLWPMAYTVHGILQARILKWNLSLLQGIITTHGSNINLQASHIAGSFFTSWTTREAQEYWSG